MGKKAGAKLPLNTFHVQPVDIKSKLIFKRTLDDLAARAWDGALVARVSSWWVFAPPGRRSCGSSPL